MHETAQMRGDVVEVAARPTHQRRFEFRLDLRIQGQDGFSQLQALHRLGKQFASDLRDQRIEGRLVANAFEFAAQRRSQGRFDDIGAQALRAFDGGIQQTQLRRNW